MGQLGSWKGEGLAPQYRDTLRALKEKHASVAENLSLPNHPDGSVVLADTENESCASKLGILVACALSIFVLFGCGVVPPSIRFTRID